VRRYSRRVLTFLHFMYNIFNMKSNITAAGLEPPRQMAYREKTAWLSLGAIAVAFVPYFTIVALRTQYETAVLPQLALSAAAACVQVLVLLAGRWYLRRQSPQDAATPPDERDISIAQRSMTAAYYVLIAGTIVAGCIMPFSNRGFAIVNAAFAAIVLAEVVHYAVAAAAYRRLA
jgi:cytochrome b561